MDEMSFCWGVLAGAMIAGIVGYVFQRMQLASKRSKAANSKQPVHGQTDQSPMDVVKKSWAAKLEIMIWIAVILSIFACTTFFLLQGR